MRLRIRLGQLVPRPSFAPRKSSGGKRKHLKARIHTADGQAKSDSRSGQKQDDQSNRLRRNPASRHWHIHHPQKLSGDNDKRCGRHAVRRCPHHDEARGRLQQHECDGERRPPASAVDANEAVRRPKCDEGACPCNGARPNQTAIHDRERRRQTAHSPCEKAGELQPAFGTHSSPIVAT